MSEDEKVLVLEAMVKELRATLELRELEITSLILGLADVFFDANRELDQRVAEHGPEYIKGVLDVSAAVRHVVKSYRREDMLKRAEQAYAKTTTGGL